MGRSLGRVAPRRALHGRAACGSARVSCFARFAAAIAAVAISAAAVLTPSTAFAGARAGDAAVARVRYADLPARLCLAPDPRTLAQARRGDVDLVLGLRNRTPVDRHSGAFTLSSIEGDARRPLHVFGMQPDHREGGRAQLQRFRIVVRDVDLKPGPRGRLCFELDAARDEPARAADAMLEIDLRWSRRSSAR
jgi:hypothetical protein